MLFQTYTIALTDADTFPLVVTFNALDRNGWSDDIVWEVPSRGWEQSQKIIRVLDTDYTFRLSIDFLDDTRYHWSDDASWNYVVPDPEARRYGDSVSHYPYDENGGYVIPVENPRASDLFVADGNSYRLNRPLTIQYWDPERGWTSAQGTFTSLTDVHQITTADNRRHAFGLSSIYSNEVRYSFTDPETASTPGWVIVGHNEETANVLFDNNGNFRIDFAEDAWQIPFPIPTYFEAYTTHGWDKPQVTLAGSRDTAQAGQGTFQKAGDVLSVVNGTATHRFTAYYPWANSVRYTLTDRRPPYTVTVGPDREFAEQNENYQYANSGATLHIEMDEGDFFPLHVTFEAKDNRGNTTTIEVKDSAGRALRDENDNPIHDVEFTKNDQSEVYQVGNYRFDAESNWMDTIRIYLPERTVSVGHGIGAHNTPLTRQWLDAHPNYQLFGGDNSYTIPLRQTDTFPLEVEFLERSVDNHTRPIRHTFQSATDTWNSGNAFSEPHTFYLQSDYTDTVRYILAYREELTDQSGVLWQDGNYEARAMTVVGNAALGEHYDHFATFDENGNFQITLPEEGPYSALPVDVWFALPDENGTYDINTVYKKVTFNSKDDRVTVSRDADGNITLAGPGEEAQPGNSTQSGSETQSAPPGPISPAHTFNVYAEWMDEVHYTLPKVPDRDELPTPQEITVGPDAARAAQEAASARDERRQPLYVTYDEDGGYLIELEDDAFFPYVVDVRYRLPTREAFVPTFDENGNLMEAFNNGGQLKPAFAKVKHVIQGGNVYAITGDGELAYAPVQKNGQNVAALDNNGLPVAEYFGEETYIVKDGFVWQWVSVTEARVPALRANEETHEIELIRDRSGVRWVGVLGQDPTIPDIDANGDFRRNEDGTIRYITTQTRSAEERGQFEFRTPSDRVTWNGHTFRVHSTRVNPNAAVRASLVLGDRTNERSVIPFRLAKMPGTPEPENTAGVRVANPRPNPNPAIAPANNPSTTSGDATAELLSTQPLTEVQLEANLEGYFNLELDNAHVELYMPVIGSDYEERLAERFVWGEWNMGNYGGPENVKDWNVNPWNRYRESVNYRVLTPAGQQASPLARSNCRNTPQLTTTGGCNILRLSPAPPSS